MEAALARPESHTKHTSDWYNFQGAFPLPNIADKIFHQADKVWEREDKIVNYVKSDDFSLEGLKEVIPY